MTIDLTPIARFIRAIRQRVRAATARKYLLLCAQRNGGLIWQEQYDGAIRYVKFESDELPD